MAMKFRPELPAQLGRLLFGALVRPTHQRHDGVARSAEDDECLRLTGQRDGSDGGGLDLRQLANLPDLPDRVAPNFFRIELRSVAVANGVGDWRRAGGHAV